MKVILSLLLGFILVFGAPTYAADSSEDTNNFYQMQPLLVDAERKRIGIFIGPTITYNEHGKAIKAFGFLSSKGYFASLRPNGVIGSVGSIYFKSRDCQGKPYLLSENDTDVTKSFLPGFVFTFGNPTQIYSIASKSRAELIDLKSELSATIDGIECVNSGTQNLVYAAVPNDFNETAVHNARYSGVTVEAKSIRHEMRDSGESMPLGKQLPSRNLESIDFNQPGNECSPGCENDFISNGYCEPECNNQACGYDANDCTNLEIEEAIKKEEAQCAPLCELEDRGDGYCDRACNNSACEFDNGDCPVY